MVGVRSVRAFHMARAVRNAAPATPAAPVVQVPAVRPVRRVGAFRGGFTGFLVGVTLTGAGAYYYLFDEYQAGQEAILADVISLRQSLQELRTTIADIKSSANSK